MQKKLTAALLVSALGLGFATAAEAQKVGFCDYRRLIAEAPQIKEAQQTVVGEFQPKFKQFEAQKKDFDSRVQKFQRDAATMADAERAKTERDLRDTEVSLSRKQKELEEDAQLRQQEVMHTVEVLVQTEVEKVAKAGGYDLIVRDAAYRNDNIDVTQQVLNSLQAKAGATAVAPAKPAGK